MGKLKYTNDKRLFFIQIMRIVACIGVFTGHFLGHTLHSKISSSFYLWLRTGFMSRTVFSYLWQGDSDVVLFFVLSGFFVTYCQNKTSEQFFIPPPEKIFKKLCYVLIPSLIVILLSIGCSFILNFLQYDSIAIKDEASMAVKRLVFEGWSENSPRFSYHLWYINTLMKCYIMSYIYIAISANNKNIRHVMYPVLLFVVWKYGYSYVVYVVGMICGELCSYLNRKNHKYNTLGAIMGITALLISPFLFNQQQSDLENKIMLGVAIGIFILGIYWVGGKVLGSQSTIIDWLDKNSFSFYLVHVLFLETISLGIYRMGMHIFNGRYEKGILLIDYAVSLSGIWFFANLYEKYIIHNIMHGVSKVINYLKHKQVL